MKPIVIRLPDDVVAVLSAAALEDGPVPLAVHIRQVLKRHCDSVAASTPLPVRAATPTLDDVDTSDLDFEDTPS